MIDTLQEVGPVRSMVAILSLHIVLTSAQFYSKRDMYREGGVLSWRVGRYHVESSILGRLLSSIIREPCFPLLLLVRLVVGLSLGVLAVIGVVSSLLLLSLFVLDVAVIMRHHGGLSGDLHMALVLSAGLTVASLSSLGSTLFVMAMGFIAIQAILSYFMAGGMKIVSQIWRHGTAVREIFGTRTWGNERLYAVLDRSPALCLLGAWSVMLFEVFFPIVLVVDQRFVHVFLAVGVLFHLSNAVFMRLNGFLIAFPASYPAVVYVNDLLTSWLAFSIGLGH